MKVFENTAAVGEGTVEQTPAISTTFASKIHNISEQSPDYMKKSLDYMKKSPNGLISKPDPTSSQNLISKFDLCELALSQDEMPSFIPACVFVGSFPPVHVANPTYLLFHVKAKPVSCGFLTDLYRPKANPTKQIQFASSTGYNNVHEGKDTSAPQPVTTMCIKAKTVVLHNPCPV